MAGKYGSNSITISLEDAPGGTARAVENFILEMGGIKIVASTERSDAFGDAWEEHTPTGKKRWEPLTLAGHWDTTTVTGPHVVFIDVDDGPQDDGRELVVVFGDSKTATGDVRLESYEVLGQNGGLTRFVAGLQPTGALTWS